MQTTEPTVTTTPEARIAALESTLAEVTRERDLLRASHERADVGELATEVGPLTIPAPIGRARVVAAALKSLLGPVVGGRLGVLL